MKAIQANLGFIFDNILTYSKLLPDTHNAIGINVDINNSIHLFAIERNHSAILKYCNFSIDHFKSKSSNNDNHEYINVIDDTNNFESRPINTIDVIDKTSICTPKHSIEIPVDKIDLSELSSKKTVLVKNINTFIMEMNSYKLKVNEDWKSVAKEMEGVWCN